MEFVVDMVSKEKWNAFVVANNGSFLESWRWGEFQEKIGHPVVRAAVVEGETVLLCATVITHALPMRKHYLYVPYGPLIASLASGGPVMVGGIAHAHDAFAFFAQGVREK